ncbi:adenylate kinase 9 [Thalassophryne amazonica]|uniref:adenylate kinase 9 n=1 Tax=Thalassophryne amazonica TaxID=390379 RepID=UPI001471AE9B|nr:adenylate kinase 9 [Thalassophryne amazonica]
MKRSADAHTDNLVDSLLEDEAERESLLSKPTCFIIVGRPGVGKSTLAKKISASWNCILIDDTDLLNMHIQNQTKEGKEMLKILSEGRSIPENVVLQLILARLNSPDVEHYGYVLSCLPFMSQEELKIQDQIELIKNLKLSPDFIINIKYTDSDLIQRLSLVRQHCQTGELYIREQFQKRVNKEVNDEDKEEDQLQAKEEDYHDTFMEEMVWTPENSTSNAFLRITTYKDTILRPLEDYIAKQHPLYVLELDGQDTPDALHSSVKFRLGFLGLKPAAVPIQLYQDDGMNEGLPDDIDTEELLRIMCSTRTVAPSFRWRRSRWGRTCPVALKEGKIIQGKPEFCVGFQDKIYILSCPEAFQKFVSNPRPYLLPPMPRPPCKVSIIGPKQAGKSALCQLLAQHYRAVVLNVEALMPPDVTKTESHKLKEDTTQIATEEITLKMELDEGQDLMTADYPEVKHLDETAIEEAKNTNVHPTSFYAELLEKRIKEIEEENTEAEVKTGWVLDNFPNNVSQMEALEQAGILPDILFCLQDTDGHQETLTLPDKWDFGDPDVPEMNEYTLQLKHFVKEWERMESSLTVENTVVEIGRKSLTELCEEMISHMQKPFSYVAWELSGVDLDEEDQDNKALTELEEVEEIKEGSDDDDSAEEENEDDRKARRILGDTLHFCPVSFKNLGVLQPCTDKIAAKYREKTYYFSSTESRDCFIQKPEQFVAQTEPLKPPALRILMLGTRGSGKTTHGKWLAQKFGIFHIQFRELLQEFIMAKTQQQVPHASEVAFPEELPAEEIEALMKELRGEDEEVTEDASINVHDTELEEPLTSEEKAIEAYLSNGEPLTAEILNMVIAPFWKQEPYMSAGFVLEGFPGNSEELLYMVEHQLFPDIVVVMEVEVADIVKRLLPSYLEKWCERSKRRGEQVKLAQDLRQKILEKKIAKRRAELMAELSHTTDKPKDLKDGEEESEDEETAVEENIEAMLLEEFQPAEDYQDEKPEETEEAATERMKMGLEENFEADKNELIIVMELLSEHNVPKVSVSASHKPRFVQCQLFKKLQALRTNRESLFQQCHIISNHLAHKLLSSSYKFYSAFGCWDPIKYEEGELIQPQQWPICMTYPLLFHQHIYFFVSKENCQRFMLNPLKYLKQPRPASSFPIMFAVVGPPKSGKTTVTQLFAKKYGLVRLSIGDAIRWVLDTQEHTALAVQMKTHLSQGLSVPDELAIQCVAVVLLNSVCSTRGYVLDGFPMTLKQAQVMATLCILPMIVVELELDTVEILKRGLADKKKPNKPYLMHDSREIHYIRNTCYKQEVDHVRQHFQQQYRNWIVLDALKNTWWLWNKIVEELRVSIKSIQSYVERISKGQAACINRMCITPKELQDHLGEFGHYCPVCLASFDHLVDCCDVKYLVYSAKYSRRYYNMCSVDHLQLFLSSPDKFVIPGCPNALPEPDLLPRKLTETQVKNSFPQQVEMKGFCPVSYLDGKQRYETLIQGKVEFAVEYQRRIYIFESKEKQEKFLRTPEVYWDQKLPIKTPPLCEPLPLTSLPALGYLEQGVSVPIIKAMTAVGCLKPKYPFLSVQRSALLYVAFYLKAFNHRNPDYICKKYKKKLALFEENCALIPYLSSNMKGNYKPPSERPFDFEFKLKRFLALKDAGVQ